MADIVPIPMILTCPTCNGRHIDEGAFATKSHHTHACQHCGMVWRPAIVPTCGVQFLSGFKNGGTLERCGICHGGNGLHHPECVQPPQTWAPKEVTRG